MLVMASEWWQGNGSEGVSWLRGFLTVGSAGAWGVDVALAVFVVCLA